MKAKTVFLTILAGTFFFFSTNSNAQTIDSTVKTTSESQVDKEKHDQQRLHSAEDLKRNTKQSANQAKADVKESKANARVAKARAREADRIEDDASDAAKQAKKALRTEAKAQQMRDNADKQAKKAARASEKSINN